MPIICFPNSKAWFIDGLALQTFFLRNRPKRIVVEQVASRPGQGIASSFQFGGAYHAVVTAALMTEAEVILCPPAKWKRRLGLIGTGKDAARIKARKLWPEEADTLFKRKKDQGRADAALIGVYTIQS